MGWVYRYSDQHRCDLPSLGTFDTPTIARPGDLWQCDDCKTVHVVREDQRDGLYFEQAKGRDLERAGVQL